MRGEREIAAMDNISGATRKMSNNQALMFGAILKGHEAMAEIGASLTWGVPVRLTSSGSASERASASRSLRRLEARGLVLRENHVRHPPGLNGTRKSALDPHNRTTYVKVTELGLTCWGRLKSEWANG